jgi:hypothetical protein
MRKLLFSLFILSSLCAYAQNELPADTIKNRLPVVKEQSLSSPKESKHTGSFDESQPEQSLQTEQPGEVDLHIPLPEYVEPLPWTDTKKIHFQSDIFDSDFQRYASFLLSPEVILTMYGDHSTYPAMGSMMQAGAGITYFSPDERWELSGGVYAANYSMAMPAAIAGAQFANPNAPRGTQWDLGLNASLAYRISDRLRVRVFGQYSGYGKSNSFHGYMNPMYPQSNYGIVMELKVSNHVEIHGGMERVYDPTKMKWTTVPMIYPVIRLGK